MKKKTNAPLPLFVVRDGLPRVAAKLAAGKTVTIAYFGGSITQADGYRVLTTKWLRERYPKSEITEINAGVGGTGSDLGAFRLAQDVICHKPDLIFVEFAINDGAEKHDVVAAVEGIVRHALRALPDCDIAFVYTLAKRHLRDHLANRYPPASRLHDPIAAHYGLPSINVALDVARRLKAKELTWDAFSRDSCHPNPPGHALYAKTMAAALTEALAVRKQNKPRRLPRPMSQSPWETADLPRVDPQRDQFPGWAYRALVNRGGWECFDGVVESDSTNPEHVVTFKFTGTAVGIYYFLGPDSGNLMWSIDKGPWKFTRLFDRWAKMFQRPSYRMLATTLKPGKHTLRLRVAPRRDRASKGKWLRIAHLLTR